MSDADPSAAAAACAADVLVAFPESLRVVPGLLAAAAACGAASGVAAAALLYVLCLKPAMLARQGYNARRMFEPDDGNADNNQGDCASNSRKEAPSGTANPNQEKRQPPMNSDVAAFASRAKVVYPINQKYRPLADGASNPSVHENSKMAAGSNASSSSSSSGDSLSQEQDNDDSSQFISTSLVPKSLQNHSFTRVSHYPQTLAHTGFEGRISLYCLALQDVQKHCYQLQEEKCQIFLHTVKIIFSHRFPKDKNEADFSKNILQLQEKGVNNLKSQWLTGKTADEQSEEADADTPCTLEEIERTQKDLLEHGLQMTRGFGRQVEHLFQDLLNNDSVLPTEEAQEIIQSLSQALLSVENHLIRSQEAKLEGVQQRLLWWEELMCLLQVKPALLRQELSLRQGLVATALEQLTGDDHLTFNLMEKTLSQLQAGQTEGLLQYREECSSKTRELLSEMCRKSESKRKKLQRSQAKESRRLLDPAQAHSDPQQFTKVYQELLVKHTQQRGELELQQDDRVAEVLCDLWRKLHSSWSKRLSELSKGVFLGALGAQSPGLSAERCEKLWLDLEEELAAQLREAESTTKMQLEDMRAQLDRERQLWGEQTTLVLACLRHLAEQQMKILGSAVVRQSYTLGRQVGKLIEMKQKHLLVAVQRHFVARHFCLHVLKEMRLSKLKVLAKTDFRVLLQDDHEQNRPTNKDQAKDSTASLAERHLGPESQLVGHSFQQEFLSELETGTELLQSHGQLLLGHALSHAVWQRMETPSPPQAGPRQDGSLKRHLTEVASESVYVTKDSLCALVQSCYDHMQDMTKTVLQDRTNTTQLAKEENLRREGSDLLNRALLRELANWGRKPTSNEFQQRVELHKRKVLEQYDLEQVVLCETLRQQRVSQDQAMERVKGKLLEAEEGFITELATLARVSLRSAEPEPSIQDDNSGEESRPVDILNLLALNPALDPALNPSLTPTIVTPAAKPTQKKKRERESQLI